MAIWLGIDEIVERVNVRFVGGHAPGRAEGSLGPWPERIGAPMGLDAVAPLSLIGSRVRCRSQIAVAVVRVVRAMSTGPIPVTDRDRTLALVGRAIDVIPAMALPSIVSRGRWEADRRRARIIGCTVHVSRARRSVYKELAQRQAGRVKIDNR